MRLRPGGRPPKPRRRTWISNYKEVRQRVRIANLRRGLPMSTSAPEIRQQFPRLSYLVAQHRSPLKPFLGEAAMLQRIAITLRSTRTFCPAMHAAALLSGDGGCPAASALARFRSAPWAAEHWPPIAEMRTGHNGLTSESHQSVLEGFVGEAPGCGAASTFPTIACPPASTLT